MTQEEEASPVRPCRRDRSPDERAAGQLAALRAPVGRLAGGPSAFWRERLAGVEGGELADLDALGGLPSTVKADFRDTYP